MLLIDDDTIERLALGFIGRSLPKAEWTHAAHFAAVLWLLRHRPALTAPDEMRRLIVRYNEATGTANTGTSGYHHTITLASVAAADHRLRAHASDTPLHEVLRALMASPLGRSDWLLAHWRRATLFSASARREWVAPDLQALPF